MLDVSYVLTPSIWPASALNYVMTHHMTHDDAAKQVGTFANAT
jgi:hypothetical protein